MNIDESTLLAYVDGALSAQQRERVEAALAHDATLRVKMDAMRASCLPYQSAYAQVAVPPLPGGLESRIAALINVADAPQPAQALSRRQWMWAGAALAASFVLGLVAPALIAKPEPAQTAQTAQPLPATSTPWVEAIASYQALYVRATVDQAPDTAARARHVLADFAAGSLTVSGSASAVTVPNLQDAGLIFKRIQRLGYGDAPLLQIVYLPTEGKPAALCVLPLLGTPNTADSTLQMRRIDGLAVAAWQKGGLAYVLTADMATAKAEAIARRLADGAFATLHQAAS